MRKFKVVAGRHAVVVDGKTFEYSEGQIITTDADLLTQFPGKFEEVKDEVASVKKGEDKE